MLPAFTKNCQTKCAKINGEPLAYSKFIAAFKVEVDKKEVYNATDKLKFLLDAKEESAKSCLAKCLSGSEKYKKTWTARDERFGRADTVLCPQLKGV